MKRVGLLIIFLIFAILPCNAKSAQDKQMQDNSLPKIFVYHIPEDNENSSEIKTQTFASKIQNDDENLQVIAPEESDIVSDDVTADTSGEEEEDLSEEDSSEVFFFPSPNCSNSFRQKISMAMIPTLTHESAKLNTGSKNVPCSQPHIGNHSGHV